MNLPSHTPLPPDLGHGAPGLATQPATESIPIRSLVYHLPLYWNHPFPSLHLLITLLRDSSLRWVSGKQPWLMPIVLTPCQAHFSFQESAVVTALTHSTDSISDDVSKVKWLISKGRSQSLPACSHHYSSRQWPCLPSRHPRVDWIGI